MIDYLTQFLEATICYSIFVISALLSFGIFIKKARIISNTVGIARRDIARSNAILKGQIGESQTSKILRKLDPTEYYVIDNVLLVGNAGSTQIDHIIVSRYGIFVIETKNINGWIWGSESRMKWTVTYRGGKKVGLYNPLIQNDRHIQVLQEGLENFSIKPMISTVCFTGECTFKTPFPPNVVRVSQLLDFIRRYSTSIIPESDVMMITSQIRSMNSSDHNSYASHERFVESVKS